VAEAARILAASARPVIVVVGDVPQCGAVGEAVAIAEMLGAAVFGEPYFAHMGFPNTHRLFAGRFTANDELVRRADAILALGVEFTSQSPSPVFPAGDAKLIVLAAEAVALGKQVWPDLGLVGHAKATLAALRAMLEKSGAKGSAAWTGEVEGHCAELRSLAESEARRGWDDTPVRIPRLIGEIEAVFGTDALIVDHATTASAHIWQLCDFSNPQRYFGLSARASAQGWGVPASIGVQIARPEQRVVAIVGDGGFMFTSTALYAAAQWQTRNVFIVLRNGGWHDIAYLVKEKMGWSAEEAVAFGIAGQPQIDYAGLAKSLAVESLRVDSAEQLPAALAHARACMGSVLIDLKSDPKKIEYYVSYMSR